MSAPHSSRKEYLLRLWRRKYLEYGIKEDIVEERLKYIDRLISNKVPIILNFAHLAALLGRTEDYLASVVNSPENHYREYQIPKRAGGARTISVPYPALLECQKWIHKNILSNIKMHSCVHGFRAKRSIVSNAKKHVGANHFLKIDISDFFPSIGLNRLIHTFKSLGYSHRIAYYLSAICSKDGCLPQGAPTSPALSNIVSRPMDWRLFNLAKHFNITYTRYADDLAFSGTSIPWKFSQYAYQVILACGFKPNESKTQLIQHAGTRVIAGISVAGKTIAVPKHYKRRVRQEVFYTLKFGAESHAKVSSICSPNALESLIGKIQFILSVEPDNKFFLRSKPLLCEQLKRYAVSDYPS